MDFLQPIIRNPHGLLKDQLELIRVLLLVAPLEVGLGEVHGEEGGRLLVDAVVEEVYAVIAL